MTDAIAPIPTCADCGARESYAMVDGRALCSPCVVLLACARKILAATRIHDVYTASDFVREPRAEVPRG